MKSNKVKIGELYIGSSENIAIQSMTNTDTNNIEETVKQSKELFDNGAELVRITVPTKSEVEKIQLIKQELVLSNYKKPIIADIHYNPEIALKVVGSVDKIRVNPGNYIEKRNISDEDAKVKLKEKFLPLIKECKKYNTAIRIGANYGSLSERILQKYGNTPLGMVKSVEGFIEICKAENFENIVVSMKASDPRIMVQACRFIQSKMIEDNNIYPQHLGVTEAGNGSEARIKTAVGMATLLSEGIGDTLRVSLTENPVAELPVAKSIVKYFDFKKNEKLVNFNLIEKLKRDYSIDGKYVVISDYVGNQENSEIDFYYLDKQYTDLDTTKSYIIDSVNWSNQENIFPLFTVDSFINAKNKSGKYNFIKSSISSFSDEVISRIEEDKTTIIIADISDLTNIFEIRNAYNKFIDRVKSTQVIVMREYIEDYNEFIIRSAGEIGSVFIDKLAGGLWLINKNIEQEKVIETAFAILQATKVRISKTEYVSCPTCGRTKFDIEKITDEIKQKTSHFKGITIAVMGCVVNGPGEMADADYGYVGAGNNLVHLYKDGKVLLKNIKQENAVNELLKLLNQ